MLLLAEEEEEKKKKKKTRREEEEEKKKRKEEWKKDRRRRRKIMPEQLGSQLIKAKQTSNKMLLRRIDIPTAFRIGRNLKQHGS